MIDELPPATPKQRALLGTLADVAADYLSEVRQSLPEELRTHLEGLVDRGFAELCLTVRTAPLRVDVLVILPTSPEPLIIVSSGLEEDNGAGSPEKLDA